MPSSVGSFGGNTAAFLLMTKWPSTTELRSHPSRGHFVAVVDFLFFFFWLILALTGLAFAM